MKLQLYLYIQQKFAKNCQWLELRFIRCQALAQDQKAALEHLLSSCRGLQHLKVNDLVLEWPLSYYLVPGCHVWWWHPCRKPCRYWSSILMDPCSLFPGIRTSASVIFTNFVIVLLLTYDALLIIVSNQDMIHASILPHEHLWRKSVISHSSRLAFLILRSADFWKTSRWTSWLGCCTTLLWHDFHSSLQLTSCIIILIFLEGWVSSY